MPLDSPALRTLFDRAVSELNADLDALAADPGDLVPIDIPLDRTVKAIIASVHAGGVHGLYQFQISISANAVPANAQDEFLLGWAETYGLSRLPATYAIGEASFTGDPLEGIPAGSLYLHPSTEVIYVLTEDVSLDNEGLGSGQLRSESSGSVGNATEGTVLKSADGSTTATATISEGDISGGADEEDDQGLRSRLLNIIQQPPGAGAIHDYERWAKEVPGVSRVWVSASPLSVGHVSVAIDGDSDTSDRTAAQSLIDAVQAYIDERRPVTAEAMVYAPLFQLIDVSLHISPSTIATRQAVKDEFTDMLERRSAPGSYIPLSDFLGAVEAADGVEDYTLITPSGLSKADDNKVFRLGEVSFL